MRRLVSVAVGLVLLATSAPAVADVRSCLDAAERAQPLRRAGSLRAARAELIACSAATCPRAVRADCTLWLSEVESALPSVVIQARDPSGADIVDVRVSIDGVVQQASLDGLAIAVDPGTRVFRFEAPGRGAAEQTLAIREGEKKRAVPIVLSGPADARSASRAPLALAPLAAVPDRRGVPAAAFVLGGAGLLAIGGGVVLWARGLSERGDLRAQCASAASCMQGDIDAAKTKLVVGDVLVGVGVLAVAAGIWLALRSGSRPSTAVTVAPRDAAVLHTF